MALDIISYAMGKKAGSGPAPTPTYQDKEITITQNGTQTITKDSGYDALNSVKITTNVSGLEPVAPANMNFQGLTMTSYTAKSNIDFTNMATVPYFVSCTNLQTLDVSAWKTSKTLSFDYFCQGCSSLTSVSFGNWDVVKVNGLYQTFSGCSNLERLDLSSFYNDGCTAFTRVFLNCSELEYLDMSNFDFTPINTVNNAFTSVPTDCLIYVKDQSQKDWFTTNVPSMTNVQIKGA